MTTDKNLAYQQNLATRRIALVVLPTTSWPRLRERTVRIAAAVSASSTGTYIEVADE